MMTPCDLSVFFGKEKHSLLEQSPPKYSKVTLRRALIVWKHCGHLTDFHYVCNYFHQLEKLEDVMTPEKRADSIKHEYNILSSLPSSSRYLLTHFPQLYTQSTFDDEDDDKNISQTGAKDLPELHIQRGPDTDRKLKTSLLVRRYCKIHNKTLKKFLEEFKSYIGKTENIYCIDSMYAYVTNKFLQDELVNYHSMPKHFNFLDIECAPKSIRNEIVEVGKENKGPSVDVNANITENSENVSIFIQGTWKKERFTSITETVDRDPEISITEIDLITLDIVAVREEERS